MQAFLVEFKAVAIDANVGDANDRLRVLRDACRRTGFDPGRGSVRPLSELEASRMPEVAAALARAREEARYRFGPPARSGEMAAALDGLTAACYDDREIANELLAHLISASGGYLPRALARELSGVGRRPAGAAS